LEHPLPLKFRGKRTEETENHFMYEKNILQKNGFGIVTWRQARAAGGELQESLPLRGREVAEDVDELDEGRRVAGVPQLGLGVPNDVLPGDNFMSEFRPEFLVET
jgi:hypothetical protein